MVLLIVLYVFYISPNLLAEKRSLASPPSILVRSPQAGDTVPHGRMLITQATVSSRNPISHVEVWLDGEVAETQTPDSQDQTTMYTYIELEISAGPHILSWRAVDSAGLVGQSTPIHIVGEPPAGVDGTSTMIAQEGQELQDIGEAYGINPDQLNSLNPGLTGGTLPPGARVRVPAPTGTGNAGQGADNAPAPPLPEAPVGALTVLPVDAPFFDLAPLVPALLTNLPTAPTDLEAGFENCTIRLVWTDNADNENNFIVWMQALGGPAQELYRTNSHEGTGKTIFEFSSPSLGIYSFWVEAVNSLGRQPSEIKWVAVNNADCLYSLPPQLEIEALGMRGFMSGGWQKVDCYLSIEGAPEKRVPEDDSQFLEYDWSGGKNRIIIGIPPDDFVTLAGDCWGWLGKPMSMGVFNLSVPKEYWDNRTLQIQGREYVIDFRVRPYNPGPGTMSANYASTFVDPTIQIPKITSILPEKNARGSGSEQMESAKRATLSWEWGEEFDTTGFDVYIDGSLSTTIPWHSLLIGVKPNEATISFPTPCGGVYQVRMATNTSTARSELSDPYPYRQPECNSYADVVLERFSFNYLDADGPCTDPVELTFDVFVNDEFLVKDPYQHQFGDELSVNCNTWYRFKDIWYERRSENANEFDAVLRVPYDPSNPVLQIRTTFWDYDGGSSWNFICFYGRDLLYEDGSSTGHLTPMSEEEWRYVDRAFEGKCATRNSNGELHGEAIIYYRVRGFVLPAVP